MSTVIYGIKNCDTMKKARTWLKDNEIVHEFWNYKKSGLDEAVLAQALKEHGWEAVINRRGTTWRNLPDVQKDAMDEAGAIEAMHDNPSLIKRPLLIHKGQSYLGFKPETYGELFAVVKTEE